MTAPAGRRGESATAARDAAAVALLALAAPAGSASGRRAAATRDGRGHPPLDRAADR